MAIAVSICETGNRLRALAREQTQDLNEANLLTHTVIVGLLSKDVSWAGGPRPMAELEAALKATLERV